MGHGSSRAFGRSETLESADAELVDPCSLGSESESLSHYEHEEGGEHDDEDEEDDGAEGAGPSHEGGVRSAVGEHSGREEVEVGLVTGGGIGVLGGQPPQGRGSRRQQQQRWRRQRRAGYGASRLGQGPEQQSRLGSGGGSLRGGDGMSSATAAAGSSWGTPPGQQPVTPTTPYPTPADSAQTHGGRSPAYSYIGHPDGLSHPVVWNSSSYQGVGLAAVDWGSVDDRSASGRSTAEEGSFDGLAGWQHGSNSSTPGPGAWHPLNQQGQSEGSGVRVGIVGSVPGMRGSYDGVRPDSPVPPGDDSNYLDVVPDADDDDDDDDDTRSRDGSRSYSSSSGHQLEQQQQLQHQEQRQQQQRGVARSPTMSELLPSDASSSNQLAAEAGDLPIHPSAALAAAGVMRDVTHVQGVTAVEGDALLPGVAPPAAAGGGTEGVGALDLYPGSPQALPPVGLTHYSRQGSTGWEGWDAKEASGGVCVGEEGEGSREGSPRAHLRREVTLGMEGAERAAELAAQALAGECLDGAPAVSSLGLPVLAAAQGGSVCGGSGTSEEDDDSAVMAAVVSAEVALAGGAGEDLLLLANGCAPAISVADAGVMDNTSSGSSTPNIKAGGSAKITSAQTAVIYPSSTPATTVTANGLPPVPMSAVATAAVASAQVHSAAAAATAALTGSNVLQLSQPSSAAPAAVAAPAAATPVPATGTGSSIRRASSAAGGDPSPLGDPGRSAHYMDAAASVPRR